VTHARGDGGRRAILFPRRRGGHDPAMAAPSRPAVAILDACGTLAAAHAAMARHATRLGPRWREVAAAWRQILARHGIVDPAQGAAGVPEIPDLAPLLARPRLGAT
jgi:hypothetical protein